MPIIYLWALLLGIIGSVSAQTFTTCNPLNETCPANPALGTSHSWVFNQTQDDKIWNVTTGEITYNEEGAQLVIAEKLQSPTIQSTFYIFFGIVETHVKMATGAGIVSSVVLQSDDLDEIDWEWVGNNNGEVQSNYYGKGDDSTYDRGGYHDVANADTEFHNYTTYWDENKLEWWIDGNLQRTLTYDEAQNGTRYPQTPSNVRIGIWPAGDSGNEKGTIEWAGGVVDYDAGPYTMVVQSCRVHDFHTGKEYSYSDNSGSWQSIDVAEGNSTAVEEINKPPEKSLSEKWDEVPTGGKIGVYVGAAVVGAMLVALLIFCCIRQRRKGRLEHALGDAQWSAERTEMNNFQTDWKQSEWNHKGGYQQVR